MGAKGGGGQKCQEMERSFVTGPIGSDQLASMARALADPDEAYCSI